VTRQCCAPLSGCHNPGAVAQDNPYDIPVGRETGPPRFPVATALLVSAVLVLALGYLETNTPTELSFGGLYFVPVALAAWAGGLPWGIAAAFGTAVDWVVASIANAGNWDHLGLRLWTGANHFASYSFLAWLVHRSRRTSQQLSAANAQLQIQSLTDPLTGLWNRRYLDVCMPADAASSVRTHRDRRATDRQRIAQNIDLVFLLLDFDHFKEVNDRHGHHAGDAVLKQAAAILRELTRASDTVIRWGGEEFLVVARNANRRDATLLAERLREGFARYTFEVGAGVPLKLTCSIGFAFYPLLVDAPGAGDWEQVLSLVDRCLYIAKREGRNAWVGVGATERFAASDVPHDLTAEVPRLLAEGRMTLQTSVQRERPLDWE